jgi:tetratricopeptide (TPR) repeat protein
MLSSASAQVSIELRLEFTSNALRPAVAWMIRSDDAQLWLEEIARWNVATDLLQLAIIAEPATNPSDKTTSRVCGVLVFSTQPIQPQRTEFALPYGCLADQFFLPVEAKIQPTVSEDELAKLLPTWHQCFVWHPTAGLIGYESADCFSVASLLSPGSGIDSTWNRAAPGIVYPQRLLSLMTSVTPTDFLEDAGDDIGTDSDSLGDLPPTSDQQQGGKISQALSGFKENIAKSVSKLTRQRKDSAGGQSASENAQPVIDPRGGESSVSWTEKLRAWASRVMNESMQKRREAELERLMELLNSDPDAGLRKALPFNDKGDQRGLANPSSGLQDRDPLFDASQMGGAGDYWHVSNEMRTNLISRYYELANREMRLKRHRRAAYIFAELLGDYASAAKALEAGGFYVPAAALYRDFLNRPVDAARCFERGGLIHQAIEIYVEQSEFESAARLYRQIDQHERAIELWKRAVDKACADSRFFDAGQIAQKELADNDLALSLLLSGWKSNSNHASQCLARWFELSGTLGRHDAVQIKIESLKKNRTNVDRADMAVHVLGHVATHYSTDAIKTIAKDTTRVIVAAQLAQLTSSATTRTWLDHLRKLEASDHLLQRDCDRFYDQTLKASRALTKSDKPISSRSTPPLHLVSRWDMPSDQRIVKAASSLQALHLITESLTEPRINLWRVPWTNQAQLDPKRHRLASWEFASEDSWIADRVLLAPDPRDQRPPLVHIVGERPLLMPKSMLGWPFRPSRRPAWLDETTTLGISQDNNGVQWHFCDESSHFKLEALGDNDVPLRSIAWHEINIESHSVELLVRHNTAFVRQGTKLWTLQIGDLNSIPEAISQTASGGVAVSPVSTRGRMIVGDATGVDLYYLHKSPKSPSRILAMDSALVAFTCDALIVAANNDRCVAMKMRHDEITIVAEIGWEMEPGIQSIQPTNTPGTLACISNSSVTIQKIR